MRRHLVPLAAVGALLLGATACGDDDDSHAEHAATDVGDDAAARTVDVTMVDTAFEPTEVEVDAGEKVRFEFTNDGALPHDAFIGDAAAQAEHEIDMGEGTEMEHGHDDPDAVTVEPGDSGELEYTFDEPGEYQIGCHQPGHYDAGMIVTVHVA